MGSIETILANFDFLKFLKDFFGQLFKGADFGDALSTAGSSAAGSSETANTSSEAATTK